VGRLSDRLAGHRRIGLDSSILIYQLENNPRYVALTTELLVGIQGGLWFALMSTVSLMEITVGPRRLQLDAVAAEYEALIVNVPNLEVLDVTRAVARQASRLRASLNLRPADAIVVATAIVGEATAFVTNDRALARARMRIDVVVLDELLLRP
jgi:predicted nucleic acid-binding protein